MAFVGSWSSVMMVSILFLFHGFGTSSVSLSRGVYRRDKTLDDLLPTEVMRWLPADTNLQCARLCQSEKWCNSFFHNHGARNCALQRMVYVSLLSNQTNTATGWRYYQLTSGRCPAQGGYVTDRLTATCYRMVTSPLLSWQDARAACNSSGEMLVVLEPVEKAQFLQDFLNTNIAFHNYDKSVYYIGASRSEAEGDSSLIWVNGQPLNLTATQAFWETSSHDTNVLRNVVVMRRKNRFLWGQGRSDFKRYYVCEQMYW